MKSFAEFCAHYELDPATAEAREEYRDYCDKLTLFRDMQPKDESELEFRRIRILSANGSPMWVDARIYQSLGLKFNEPSPFLTAEEVTAAYLAKGGSDE
jgi:hypothetical protein